MATRIKALSHVLVFVAISCMYQPVLAQQNTPRKVMIELTNGTVLQGEVIEWADGGTLKMTLDGNASVVVEIAFDQIKFMSFDGAKIHAPLKVKEKTVLDVIDPRDFYHNLSFGLLFGENESNLTFGAESGFRFNDHFALGLGANYDQYDIVSSVPVFANTRLYLNEQNVTPYFFLGGGYGFNWLKNDRMDDWQMSNEKIKNGTYGQSGIGMHVRSRDLTMAFVLGYKFQKSKIEYDYNLEPWRSDRATTAFVQEERTFRRIFFSMIFAF